MECLTLILCLYERVAGALRIPVNAVILQARVIRSQSSMYTADWISCYVVL